MTLAHNKPVPTYTPHLGMMDAVTVWYLRWLGWKIQDIAGELSVNHARIAEVLSGHRCEGSRELAKPIAEADGLEVEE